jgi:hypothetical protein
MVLSKTYINPGISDGATVMIMKRKTKRENERRGRKGVEEKTAEGRRGKK